MFLMAIFNSIAKFIKSLPIIKDIPNFNSVPKEINEKNLRFYKLSNLVLTLGMAVHLMWVTLFFYLNVWNLFSINILSSLIYIFCIVINRKGYHFTSSVLMVFEIIIHQIFAINELGLNAGFQYYIIVIGLFPFLMPKGKWGLKILLLSLCLISYVLLEEYFKLKAPLSIIPEGFISFFRISNIIFSFSSLDLSGAYFNIVMHETEELLEKKTTEVIQEKAKADELLLNILPAETAEELKKTGKTIPKLFDSVSVLFTDFKNFTKMSEELNAKELVEEIHYYYCEFDKIISQNNIEKIKTIGDSYMAVAGLPGESNTHSIDTIKAAQQIISFINIEKKKRELLQKPFFEIRIGIHSGPVIAGIVGTKKFAYDVWGDTVNIASRMESSCIPGQINVSGSTYNLAKDYFQFNYRGKIQAKNKGEIDMYFVLEQ